MRFSKSSLVSAKIQTFQEKPQTRFRAEKNEKKLMKTL